MSNLTSDELHHAGRKGMKWGMNIFGRRRTGSGGRFRRDKNADPKNVKIPKKIRKSVDERMREAEFLDMYRSRDNMSTKALKSKIARLEAERKFKELVEAPEKARRKALQKKKQARLAFVGKAASAALDVYSKVPSSVVGNGKSGQAAKDAIKAFKKKQEWAKAFKDVPTTMTKFTQSGVNMGETINGVYIPSQDDLLLHYGKKGMKWKKHLTNGVNSVLEGIENAANWVDDQTFDKSRESALRDRSESNNRRINDSKYGRTYNTASDPIDGKRNVDVKRALREGRDNVVPSRTREGMRQENKFIEKIRKRIKLPRLKQSISSENTLLHYGKKGMKWKKKGGGSDLMTPAEAAANEARVKKDDKTYNYNLKMRDEAIKNALKRGASGKEIRRLQDMRVEDQRKVDMNNRHKKALKNKDNRRSSYSREVTVADAKSGKLKKYKY